MKKNPLNLVDLARKGRFLPGRVSLPDVDQGEIERHRAFVDWQVRQRRGFVVAMLTKGKPFARRTLPARKRKRPTKNVRHAQAVAVRAAYVKDRAE